ncbi:MAG: CD225/dispanin family protein [Bacteroidales bacterium]|nr:CD225/dispanin family protein [Bacteroides sp.]MCM1197624.1 CD225/dispanin family protein [Clostridium sp.]MCM1502351.1 CD225/dispanin family protein [Bacteroidales bacterium]
MYCKKCGAELPDRARYCTACGQDQQSSIPVQPVYTPETQPDTYLILSIIVTVMCCVPFGVAGIVYASKVSSAWAAGQYEDARMYSRKARSWALWGIGATAIFLVLYIILIVFCVCAGIWSADELGRFV